MNGDRGALAARGLVWLAFALPLGGCAMAAPAAPMPPAALVAPAEPMRISSIGDRSLGPLMDAWLQALAEHRLAVMRGRHWEHVGDAAAIGALMFERADIAPMSRRPLPAELAPYAHEFAGDMMKSPTLVQVAWQGDRPAWLAFNKRPDSPLPPNLLEFVRFALSADGQAIVARSGGFRALSAAEAAQELPKLEGYRAPLDPALPHYAASVAAAGAVRSVGSDGMKSLMDRWMRDFQALQPGVRRGDRWEHLGTLNGFHALMAGETDLAPMGRELWADEKSAFTGLHDGEVPMEIRVARGGFDTQQRTTAQAVFVHGSNPLRAITLAQLTAIFGQHPTITRWGQLGLTGEWARRPIILDMPPRTAPNAMSMQAMVLNGGAWGDGVHEGTVADTAKAIAAEPGAIGFGGFEDGGPGLKALAVARDATGPAIAGTPESASTGHYPLTRYMYIRFRATPAHPVSSAMREFLRYVLSREGQEPILYSGYFPLTAREVSEELAKLDEAAKLSAADTPAGDTR